MSFVLQVRCVKYQKVFYKGPALKTGAGTRLHLNDHLVHPGD